MQAKLLIAPLLGHSCVWVGVGGTRWVRVRCGPRRCLPPLGLPGGAVPLSDSTSPLLGRDAQKKIEEKKNTRKGAKFTSNAAQEGMGVSLAALKFVGGGSFGGGPTGGQSES